MLMALVINWRDFSVVREILFLYCYAFSVSLLLTPLCCDDIHDVTPRVSALAGCDTLRRIPPRGRSLDDISSLTSHIGNFTLSDGDDKWVWKDDASGNFKSAGQPGNIGPTAPSGQATMLPYAFTTGTLYVLASGSWNFDTVTAPSAYPHAFLGSQHTVGHQTPGHLGGEVMRRLVSLFLFRYNKEKPPFCDICCQLGKT
ncbi:hypothetical protein Tco_1054663 [Tanacetum coccineum]|uniref:Uncharacterized protein n=1 Tax=Tanacetum coccineum TaxID=301880 RepID=A0ABQ5GYP1_9ASTR